MTLLEKELKSCPFPFHGPSPGDQLPLFVMMLTLGNFFFGTINLVCCVHDRCRIASRKELGFNEGLNLGWKYRMSGCDIFSIFQMELLISVFKIVLMEVCMC